MYHFSMAETYDRLRKWPPPPPPNSQDLLTNIVESSNNLDDIVSPVERPWKTEITQLDVTVGQSVGQQDVLWLKYTSK